MYGFRLLRTELCRAEHRALLFWVQTGDGGQGVHWNLRARVFFRSTNNHWGAPTRRRALPTDVLRTTSGSTRVFAKRNAVEWRLASRGLSG